MISFLIQWILSHPKTDVAIIIAIVEMILRLFPTSKNYSMLDKLHTLLNLILPNLKDKEAVAKLQAEQNKIAQLLNKDKNVNSTMVALKTVDNKFKVT